MKFLGTGAAELIPSPFCKCPKCEYARRHPEEGRRRSSFLLDEHTCIDFGPDTIDALHQYNICLNELHDILFTHAHADHFSIANLNVVTMNCVRMAEPFKVHMSQEAYDYLVKVRDAVYAVTDGYNDIFAPVKGGFYEYVPHKAFETFTIGNKTVFTVRGFHKGEGKDERSMHYRITENGRTLLYALDGGLYEPESLEALSGYPVDILIMDATFGSVEQSAASGHLCGPTFVKQLENLIKGGTVTEKTRVYATHINPKGVWNKKEYQEYFDDNAPVKVLIASDGMEIDW